MGVLTKFGAGDCSRIPCPSMRKSGCVMDVAMSALAPMAATLVAESVCEPLVPAPSEEGGFVVSRSSSLSVERVGVCAVVSAVVAPLAAATRLETAVIRGAVAPLSLATSVESVAIRGVAEKLADMGCTSKARSSASAAT